MPQISSGQQFSVCSRTILLAHTLSSNVGYLAWFVGHSPIFNIKTMNADGSNQVCLSNNSSSDVEPSFSPDGTKVLFASDRDHAGAASIYVMNSDGSNQHALTSTTAT